MKTGPVIARIKATMAARFGTRVGGTAEFVGARDSQDTMAVPHAFVMTLPDEPTEPLTVSNNTQAIDDRLCVIVAVSNTADPRGQNADDQLDDIRTELLDALMNWEPGDPLFHSALIYDGFENIELTRARLWRRFNFRTITVV